VTKCWLNIVMDVDRAVVQLYLSVFILILCLTIHSKQSN